MAINCGILNFQNQTHPSIRRIKLVAHITLNIFPWMVGWLFPYPQYQLDIYPTKHSHHLLKNVLLVVVLSPWNIPKWIKLLQTPTMFPFYPYILGKPWVYSWGFDFLPLLLVISYIPMTWISAWKPSVIAAPLQRDRHKEPKMWPSCPRTRPMLKPKLRISLGWVAN